MKVDSYCVSCGVITSAFGSPQPASHRCVPCAEYDKQNSNLSDTGHPLQDVEDEQRLKLFKVTIPSQTINQEAALRGTDKWVVGEIKDYGFIQGREIFVLATDRDRLYKQCLRELGCTNPADVELKVEELEGPFEHGYVIAYNQPNGL